MLHGFSPVMSYLMRKKIQKCTNNCLYQKTRFLCIYYYKSRYEQRKHKLYGDFNLVLAAEKALDNLAAIGYPEVIPPVNEAKSQPTSRRTPVIIQLFTNKVTGQIRFVARLPES